MDTKDSRGNILHEEVFSSMKKLVVFLVILMPAITAFGQQTMRLDNQKDSAGNVYTYTGDVINTVPNGKGLAVYYSGDKYFGDFKNGMINGNGVFLYSDNRVAIGQYVNGKIEGEIIYFSAEGHLYMGEYRNNFTGYAKELKADNTFMAGYLVNGLHEGRSILTDQFGNLFAGFFSGDMRNGPGLQYEPKQKRLFEGIWKDNKWLRKEQTNLQSFIKDTSFKGFENGEKILASFNDGKGGLLKDTCVLYKLKTKERFFGNFKDGYMSHGFHATGDSIRYYGGWAAKGGEGKGVYCKTGRYIASGIFKNGILDGDAIFINIRDNIIYEGQISKGSFTGKATQILKNNTIESGLFKAGVLDGEGYKIYSTGEKVTGVFKAGKIDTESNK
ncbi:phosphatidylinositol-4-phosphate 5-kinase [soil metagenome]